MNIIQACEVIHKSHNERTFLIATMGAMRAFDILDEKADIAIEPGYRLSSVPLMGGAAGLGLGLALGSPDKKIIVIDGDASLVMELGTLVTVAKRAPKNLMHVVINNGTQFTGLANLNTPTEALDFSAVAMACGYKHAVTIDSYEEWQTRFSELEQLEGPVFINLLVESAPMRANKGFRQEEMPDYQFTRMGTEFYAMKERISGERA